MRLEKIINAVGVTGGGIWCGFTLLDLMNGPYWSVSAKLLIANAIYFTGKFSLGAYVFSRSFDNLLRRR